MRREYYLHKRPNGIYYVQFVDKVSGKSLSAKFSAEANTALALGLEALKDVIEREAI